tara:strand:+ start:106 stop:1314 length:1209 start_codon:yes stop_codon:yes gene_type:complete
MAKKNETTEPTVEQPKVDNEVEKIKVKKKLKKIKPQEDTVKVDLKKLVEEAENVVKVDLNKPVEDIKAPDTEVKEEVQKVEEPKAETEEAPVIELEEIKEEPKEEVKAEEPIKVEEPIVAPEKPTIDLPENVNKLLDFMKDTGGDINDYVRLNMDYSELDNHTLLREYYKTTKPHLDSEEVDFLMEDTFSFDEEVDDEKDIRRKKLALKEQVANARNHLDGLKSKYYEDIKAGSKLTSEQQKAIDFFNRYNKESEAEQKALQRSRSAFQQKTDSVFNDEFKGFEYNVGDKRFRFNVKDVNKVKESQSDINNFVKKFLNNENLMEDGAGYHKSMFTAMNADAVAKHFYEQGKADALKESIAKSKNVNMDPRQSHSGEIQAGGIKVRVLGEDANDFKFKIKRKQ